MTDQIMETITVTDGSRKWTAELTEIGTLNHLEITSFLMSDAGEYRAYRCVKIIRVTKEECEMAVYGDIGKSGRSDFEIVISIDDDCGYDDISTTISGYWGKPITIPIRQAEELFSKIAKFL